MYLGEIVEIGPRASAEPIRAVDYRHAPRPFRQVVQGHLVQEIAGWVPIIAGQTASAPPLQAPTRGWRRPCGSAEKND
jgi:hypothetical protein